MPVSRRLLCIYFTIGVLILILSKCADLEDSQSASIRGTEYAAQESCVKCHRDISATFSETSHFHTSAPVTADLADVPKNESTFAFNDSLKVVVEKRNDRMFQVAYYNNKEIEAHQFDIVFGSGEKAKTFAYWEENSLFQLPLTYYSSINKWTNSPGFIDNEANFKRAIVSRCFECHSSFAKTQIVKTGSLSVTEEIVKGAVLYGIDCQRCHGPSAKHVTFHEENPEEKAAKYMIRFSDLSRQQKVDMCAVCHSGNDRLTQMSTFTFTPGDTLSDYYFPQYTRSRKEPDVHGNQYGMLASSACFIKSQMDCSSCHNTHVTEKNKPALFSQRCMSCHNADQHPLKQELGKATLVKNCIDCHMPVKPSRLISFQVEGETQKTPYQLRSHQIAVYPEETQKILTYLKFK